MNNERAMNPFPAIIALLDRARRFLNGAANVLDLAIRVLVARDFFLSGLTKIRDWDTTLALFQDEYHVPVLPPELAAIGGTFGELFFPVLLVLGLGTRFAALGMSLVNVMAVVSYWHVLKDLEPALAMHVTWAILLLVILFHGPGKISLDAWIWRRWGPAAA